MSNIGCMHCGNLNMPQSQYCQKCGAPLPQAAAQAKQGNLLKVLGVFGAITLAGFVILGILENRLEDKNKNQAQSKPEQVTTSSQANAPRSPATPQPGSAAGSTTASQSADTQDQQKAKESAEHLAEAKKALADGYKPNGKDRAWGRVKDARQHLEQIQSSDKEYVDAQKLLQEVTRREAEIEKYAKAVARQYYANELEKIYLGKGMDVEVSVSGPDNTIIKLKYVLMSRPLVYQMTNDDDVKGKLRELGFKKIIFTDGYSNTWNYDL